MTVAGCPYARDKRRIEETSALLKRSATETIGPYNNILGWQNLVIIFCVGDADFLLQRYESFIRFQRYTF